MLPGFSSIVLCIRPDLMSMPPVTLIALMEWHGVLSGDHWRC